MTDDLTNEEFDEALAIAAGRKPRPMTAEEAEFELASAEIRRREPDPRAVATRERIRVAQEAVRDVAPWRAAVRWAAYNEQLEAEENLAQLWSSRRGITVEHARAASTQALREAWTAGGATDDARLEAATKELIRFTNDFARRPAIVPAAGATRKPAAETQAAAGRRTVVREAGPAPQVISQARELARRQVATANTRLTEASVARIVAEATRGSLPMTQAGQLDTAAFTSRVSSVRQAEEAYLEQVSTSMGAPLAGASQHVLTEAGLDATGTGGDLTEAEFDEALAKLTGRTSTKEA